MVCVVRSDRVQLLKRTWRDAKTAPAQRRIRFRESISAYSTIFRRARLCRGAAPHFDALIYGITPRLKTAARPCNPHPAGSFMPFGFYIIMAAQFFSSLADNA